MAKIVISGELQTTPDRCWAIYYDPAFNRELRQKLAVESIDEYEWKETEDTIRMVYKVTVRRTLPDWVRKVVGDPKISYTSTDVFYKKTFELHQKMSTDILKDRFRSSGVWSVKPSREGFVTRRYDGEVRIEVPLIGGKMEERLAAALTTELAESTTLLRNWIEKDRAALAAGEPLPTLTPAGPYRA